MLVNLTIAYKHLAIHTQKLLVPTRALTCSEIIIKIVYHYTYQFINIGIIFSLMCSVRNPVNKRDWMINIFFKHFYLRGNVSTWRQRKSNVQESDRRKLIREKNVNPMWTIDKRLGITFALGALECLYSFAHCFTLLIFFLCLVMNSKYLD